MNMNPRRLFEWSVPAVGVVVAVIGSLLAAGDVPSPMAVHWGPGGEPDGAASLLLETALIVGLVGPVGGWSMWAAGRAPSRRTARLIIANVLGASGFFVVIHLLTLRANSGVATWQQADALTVATVLGWPLAAGVVLGLAGWWSSGDRPDPDVATYPAEPVEIAPGEAVVWSGGATGALVYVLPVAGAALAAILWLTTSDPGVRGGATGVAVVAVALVFLVRVRVTAGPYGLVVALGPLGWPRVKVALDRIEDVTVEHVEPMAYGGWGYRLVPGARGVIVRRGPGLRVARRGRPDLVVTVDDARTAAGVLLAHLGQRTGHPRG